MRAPPPASALLACALVGALSGAACGTDTLDVLIDLRTDYVGQVEVREARTRLASLDDEGTVLRSSVEPLPAGDLLEGTRIAELSGLAAGAYTVTVELTSLEGAIVATRRVSFTARSRRGLTIVITRDCAGITCPPAGGDPTLTSCVGGRCVAPECTPESPEACPDPICESPSECPPGDACQEAQCLGGSCVLADACGAGEYCSMAGMGCVPIPADGGFSDGGAGSDAGTACVLGETRCVGDALETCTDGVAGFPATWVSEPCPLGCVSGAIPPRCFDVLPSNALLPYYLGTSDVLVSSPTTWNTADCAGLPGSPTTVARTGFATPMCVVRGRNIDIASTLTVTGSSPLVLLATDTITVSGSVEVGARGSTAGPGAQTVGVAMTPPGFGRPGGTSGANRSAGAGGGGYCTAGGPGGGVGTAPFGMGGVALGASSLLQPLIGGTPGGPGGGSIGGSGGGGGGAIQLTARTAIHITGLVGVGGGGAGGGRAVSATAGGGGGGSGGAVLLEAPLVELARARIVLTGGGGGGGSPCTTGGGGTGSDGSSGGAAGTAGTCTGGLLGAGSGGPGYAIDDGGGGISPTTADGAGGGGGGGGGCLVIRNADGILRTPPPDTAPFVERVRTY